MQKLKSLLLMVAFLKCLPSQSQTNSKSLPIFSREDSVANFYSISSEANLSNEGVIEMIKSEFHLDSKSDFLKFRSDKLTEKIRIDKYVQIIDNILVENSYLYLYVNENNTPIQMIVSFGKGIVNSKSSLIDSIQAIAIAFGYLNNNLDYDYLQFFSGLESKTKKLELVLLKNEASNKLELCYKVLCYQIESNQSRSLNFVYVNAVSKLVVKNINLTMNCFKPKIVNQRTIQKNQISIPSQSGLLASCNTCVGGTTDTHFYGNQSIFGGEFPNGFGCRYNLEDHCGTTKYSTQQAPSIESTYISGVFTKTIVEHSSPTLNNNEVDAGTVHWCTKVTIDYFKNVHSHNGMNGTATSNNPFWLRVYKKVGFIGFNAFYNLTNDDILCGSGDISNGNLQVASIDVMGHEFTHGLRRYSTNSTAPSNGIAGAIEESFGDIFGTLTEFETKNNISGIGSGNYLIGEDVMSGSLRNMSNPLSLSHPDYLNGQFWAPTASPSSGNDWGGIHTNCGIQNKWFHLLAEGGVRAAVSGPFPTVGYCINGIGRTKAAQIAYAYAMSLPANINTYGAARAVCLAAATVLFGANSDEVAQCTQAWFAVGVGGAYTGVINYHNQTINTTSSFTNYNSRVQVKNVTINSPADFTVTSNTEIQIADDFNTIGGSGFNAYITPAICNGSPNTGAARGSNLNAFNNYDSHQNINLVSTEKSKEINDNNKNIIVEEDIIKTIPNPFNSSILIVTRENLPLYNLRVQNNLNQEVFFKSEHNSNEYIDLSSLSRGIYFLHGNIGNETFVKKIVKD